MTIETTYRIAPQDLVRVALECRACGTSITLRVDATAWDKHSACPQCGDLWLPAGSAPAKVAIECLERAVRILRQNNPQLPLALYFETAPPPAPAEKK